MSEEIRPALTPEEWEEPSVYSIGREEVDGDVDAMRVGIRVEQNREAGTRYLVGWNENSDYPYESVIQGEKIAKLVAIANHALPDGHPLKITREDVKEMEIASYLLDGEGRDGAAIAAIAAKLAALLPPE